MKLSECNLGQIVKRNNNFDEYDNYPVGHITGLKRIFYEKREGGPTNYNYYVIPLVKFADATESVAVDPSNLDKLEY